MPAGWYPSTDPNKPGVLQWWDGSQWSEFEHTDFSSVDASKLSKSDARALIGGMQLSLRNLEELVNRHGLRSYQNFEEWRDSEINILNSESESRKQELASLGLQRDRLQKTVDKLQRDVIMLPEVGEMQQVGLFNFEHPAESSTELATELASLRTQIKAAVRDKRATQAVKGFTFNNSAAKGRKFVNSLSTLLLRAYNAEAENAIKTTKAGNLETAQARLSRAAEQIAKNGAMISLRITDYYHRLRLQEIELAHRHLKALQVEKELEREHRAELREQKKAEAELKREQERLAKEKSHYEAALAALRSNGDIDGVERMMAKLADVERAIADVDYRAANMRAGYVYVISNVGSFGPDIVKIGMTRRLDPMDRVRELGDASVPFKFDVHALFFADDAVSVENMLHKEFAATRINQVNSRREYFRATPQQVLEILQRHSVEVLEFTITPEAEEFMTSQAILEAQHAPSEQ